MYIVKICKISLPSENYIIEVFSISIYIYGYIYMRYKENRLVAVRSERGDWEKGIKMFTPMLLCIMIYMIHILFI